MSNTEIKTKASKASVSDFLESIKDPQKKADSKIVLKLMEKITGEKPKMWGSAIIGFGDTHYKYASGREGDWFKMGFSPRANALTIYGIKYYEDFDKGLFSKLGKYTEGKGCVYIKRLSDVDLKVLEKLISQAAKKPVHP